MPTQNPNGMLEGCTQGGGTTDNRPLHWCSLRNYSWTNLYLRSVRMGKGRGDQHITHFWWEQPLSINVAESLPLGDEEDDEGDDQSQSVCCLGRA